MEQNLIKEQKADDYVRVQDLFLADVEAAVDSAFKAGWDERQQLLQQTDVSGSLPPSGIEEFDELIKLFQNSEIDFLTLTCGLWNKGYNAGKEYCSGGNGT
ncbi:MAG: hypothetical protein V4615_04995 [Bacteroidota bacterium]